jgi:glucan phosphoethanolaminetransferase (alkaline phosphatase superfamily)
MKIVLISFIILTAILWCWAVFDLVKSRFKNPIHKALGLLMILFFPVLGSILYFQLKEGFVQKKRREFNPDFTYLRKN